MAESNKKVTVYMKPEFHRALRVKAAETDLSVSDLINDAVRNAMIEDSFDLESFEARAMEPSVAFEDVLKKLKRDGKI
ncbi:MAG: CopG family transcriptional regulator [Candidatus Aminicenantales bacterium]